MSTPPCIFARGRSAPSGISIDPDPISWIGTIPWTPPALGPTGGDDALSSMTKTLGFSFSLVRKNIVTR
ncbi:hypothetical protein N665_0401s0035 [Sinapis alba]|nr:hypothetical protein N665_0401s0035 [Sinapis alba]